MPYVPWNLKLEAVSFWTNMFLTDWNVATCALEISDDTTAKKKNAKNIICPLITKPVD